MSLLVGKICSLYTMTLKFFKAKTTNMALFVLTWMTPPPSPGLEKRNTSGNLYDKLSYSRQKKGLYRKLKWFGISNSWQNCPASSAENSATGKQKTQNMKNLAKIRPQICPACSVFNLLTFCGRIFGQLDTKQWRWNTVSSWASVRASPWSPSPAQCRRARLQNISCSFTFQCSCHNVYVKKQNYMCV